MYMNPKSNFMRLYRLAFLLILSPIFAFSQSNFHGDASGSVYFPVPFEIVPDINAESYEADFGWPEIDVNLYYDLIQSDQKGRSFLSLYAGGNYRNMFGLEEDSDSRDFEGAMTSRQFRAGLKIFDLVRASYIRAGISGTGTGEGVFQNFTYGGPVVWTDGFEIGLQAEQEGDAVGLFYQSSFAPPAGDNVTAVEWSTLEGRVRSSVLSGRGANGFVQLTVGYDLFSYDDRDQSNNLPMEFKSLRIGLGIGVGF